MRARKLLVVGLDAVEAPVLDDLLAAGRLPVLAGLAARGVSADIEASCMSSLPGAIWQDLLTGRSAWRHGDYYPSRLHTGEDAVREIDPKAHVGHYFFDHAAAAGRRGIVIDAPLVPPYTPEGDLTLVSEWHVHDAIWERGSHPPALLAQLEGRFGRRPYDRCDTNHDGSPASLRSFTDMLETELAVKTDMVAHLLATRPWDFVTVGISQGHCAGHQLWHEHDARRRAGAGRAPDSLVVEVYEAIDAALGRLVEAAGPDVGVVVFTSHGMENYVGGPQLLPRLIEAWGLHRPPARRLLLRRIVPKGLAGRLFRAAPWLQQAAVRHGAWTDHLTTSTSVIAVANNRVGALRLNVVGREPNGVVSDVDRALDDLEQRLRSLRHEPSGESVVDSLIRPADAYGPDAHPDLPDLLVVFRRDLGEITEVSCPQVGTIEVPIRRPQYQRTGDHTDRSRLWIDHPAVAALTPMRSEDLAPTLLELLDVPVPPGLDGAPAARPAAVLP